MRLQNYDYTTNGAYFITICTHQHGYFFGECNDGQMTLSTIGAIAQGFWYEIPKHFVSVTLGEFVVMPNHIHGILILDTPTVETLHRNVCPAPTAPTPTNCNNPAPPPKNEFFSNISPKANSISTIIRSYKSICSKHINPAFPQQDFKWQARFYEHIIRYGPSY
ncbi:MAG: hypothetical protein Q8N96_07415, partial [Methylovulum sp.]|nr:hypothetical protein [Methylovulum sp.]